MCMYIGSGVLAGNASPSLHRVKLRFHLFLVFDRLQYEALTCSGLSSFRNWYEGFYFVYACMHLRACVLFEKQRLFSGRLACIFPVTNISHEVFMWFISVIHSHIFISHCVAVMLVLVVTFICPFHALQEPIIKRMLVELGFHASFSVCAYLQAVAAFCVSEQIRLTAYEQSSLPINGQR